MSSAQSAPGSWTDNRPLGSLLLVGALVRVALICWFHGQPIYVQDAQSYHDIAVNLVRSGEFAETAGSPTSIRPPLYPLLVVGIYRVAGLGNHDAVRAVQAVLSLLGVVLLYRLAVDLFDRRVALWSAALMCFYPSLLWLGCMLLSETLFIIWLLLLCLCLRAYLVSGQVVHLVALGVALGLGALTRSILWLFPPFLLAALLLVVRARWLLPRLCVAAVPILAFALTILPWSIRNTRLQRTFTTIDVMGGRNFMMGNYEYTPLYRAWDAIALRGPQAWIHVLLRDKPADQRLTQGQIDKLAMRRTIGYVLDHPGLTFQRSVIRFCNFWQLERSLVSGALRGWWGIQSRAAVLSLAVLTMGSYALCLGLAIFGFCVVPAADRRMHWFILLLIAFVCAVHTVTFGHSRYHLPLVPLILLYSGAAIVHYRDIWRRRRSAPCALACVMLIGLVTSWMWEFIMVDLPRSGGDIGR